MTVPGYKKAVIPVKPQQSEGAEPGSPATWIALTTTTLLTNFARIKEIAGLRIHCTRDDSFYYNDFIPNKSSPCEGEDLGEVED